jgi:hypothetical protein
VDIATNNPLKPRYWHYWIGLVLGLALLPVLYSEHLPLKFDWVTLGTRYWLVLAAQSIFVAAILGIIGLPQEEVWRPFMASYRQSPPRIVLVIVYFAILFWATSAFKAVILSVDAVAVLELLRREKGRLRPTLVAVFVPAVYLFFGLLMVLAYNSAIVTVRFNFATDPALAAIDRWMLHGHSVSELAHWAVRTLPISVLHGLEFIYFGMFPQIGASLILVALCDGRQRGLRLVGTILLAYYLALAIFYIWPSQGPYYVCEDHFRIFPPSLTMYNLQKTLIQHAMVLWQHQPIRYISTDYLIGFPCMHVAQPMIVLWFLRRWRGMAIALGIYDLFLVASILMLEQHYVIDVLAGLLVGAVAIAITGGPFRVRTSNSSGVERPGEPMNRMA